MLENFGGIINTEPNASHVRLQPWSPKMPPEKRQEIQGLAKLRKMFLSDRGLYETLIMPLNDQNGVVGEIDAAQVLRYACCCASVVYLRFVKGSPLAS